ncbi:hypothetical protein FPZ54_08960 [Sphingomonas suaedae]|uniref:Uncharacterized protein n=1 Tax=Sphingomonas suaedae TaxID=2599297 RepID=A0A518RFB9_9SPHN|nr:hypothetical protein [Sphingomonas suaedae]QDX26138.1 hypothetical protein FPZ54_08960 [Sphingomonas suaedae]
MAANADAIIDQIDAGGLSPLAHAVVRALHRHIEFTHELQNEVLVASYHGVRPEEMSRLNTAIWNEIDARNADKVDGLRLSLGLTMPDGAVDGYHAGFLIHWARTEGASEQQIIDSFLSGSNGS